MVGSYRRLPQWCWPVSEMYGDPLSAPFWEAAQQRKLIIQRCRSCGGSQFYPRPFCLTCQSDAVDWVDALGTGAVYSVTTVRVNVRPELSPPYQVAIVELDEGPRMLAAIVGGECRIGDRVEVGWQERIHGPPLPVFGRPGSR
jgi:uncharacterized OB-fold protein